MYVERHFRSPFVLNGQYGSPRRLRYWCPADGRQSSLIVHRLTEFSAIEQDRTCVSGHRCGFVDILGMHLQGTDRLELLEICGMRSNENPFGLRIATENKLSRGLTELSRMMATVAVVSARHMANASVAVHHHVWYGNAVAGRKSYYRCRSKSEGVIAVALLHSRSCSEFIVIVNCTASLS